MGLLPGCPSQQVIDPILPTRPRLLEIIKNIPIDAQRDLFFLRLGKTVSSEPVLRAVLSQT